MFINVLKDEFYIANKNCLSYNRVSYLMPQITVEKPIGGGTTDRQVGNISALTVYNSTQFLNWSAVLKSRHFYCS
jgi:hypothetical protein